MTNKINAILDKGMNFTKLNSKNEELKEVENLANIIINKDFDKFLNVTGYILYKYVSRMELNEVLLEKTEGLTKNEYIKQLILKNKLYNFTLNNKGNDIKIGIDVLKEMKRNNIHLYDVSRPNILLDFNDVVDKDFVIEFFLLNEYNLYYGFKNIDISLFDKKYFEDKKYTLGLFKSFYNKVYEEKVFKMIPKENGINDANVGYYYGKSLLDFYGTDIVKETDIHNGFNINVIHHLLKTKNASIIFTDFYNKLINDKEILRKLLLIGDYGWLKYIKDKDFYKLRDLLIDRLNSLEEEICD